MFRSISNTNQDPAAQVEFDATYGMFWAYIWGSNTAFGDDRARLRRRHLAQMEGHHLQSIGGLYYTFPGGSLSKLFRAEDRCDLGQRAWSLGINNYWSPDNFQRSGNSDAIEGAVGYTFARQAIQFLHAHPQRRPGFQSFEKVASDYTYWNAGLTLGFLDHWSADVRY